jgi:hypothetical protein
MYTIFVATRNSFKTGGEKMDSLTKYERMVIESRGKRLTKAKAIRIKCLECCYYQPIEVSKCVSKDCPLWRYRTGKEERDELYYSKPKMNRETKEHLKKLK